jgi:hypothetical protein
MLVQAQMAIFDKYLCVNYLAVPIDSKEAADIFFVKSVILTCSLSISL